VPSATALAAATGDGRTFARGRDSAARLGPVPRRATTGGEPRLPGTSERGGGYLRRLLIHGARAALPSPPGGATPLGDWPRGLPARAHRNVAVVSLAAGLARVVTAVPRGGGTFEAKAAAAQPTGSSARVGSARAGGGVRGWRERDGLTVDRRPGTPGRKAARRRRRRFYEDPGARTSISAGARPRDRIG